MGQLYKRNGTYYGDYYDRNGARQRKSLRTADPQVARVRLREFELQTTDRGTHQTEELSDALDYFTNVACAGKSDGTIRCYSQKAAHLSRLIGDTLVDKLSREVVERYIATRLEEGAHRHSVHKELVVLRGSLKSARARDRFHQPLEIIPEFDSGYTPRTTYLTSEQFLAMVELLVPRASAKAKERTIERREALKRSRAFYCTLIAFASARRGELEAIEWHHVDLARGMIRIPKGKTISRVVAIHPVLRPWLEGYGEAAGWVGKLVEPWSNVGRDLPAACLRAGVPRVTPNDLRRTFASWLVQAGTSLYVVSRLLGHKSTRMVELVYGQLDDVTLNAAIMRLPGCDAGVSREMPRGGAAGTTGHTPSTPMIVNSVENSTTSTEMFVPRDGVEPPTRGFSVLADLAPKRSEPQRKLAIVK